MGLLHRLFAASVLMLAAGSSLLLGQDTAVSDEKITSLFDGKTFQGWEGDLAMFRIEQGAIVGGRLDKAIPHNKSSAQRKTMATSSCG